MRQQWHEIKSFVYIGCLIVCLLFPILSLIPLIGYIAQIGAMFGIILFSFKKKYLLLSIGAIGSLIVTFWFFGFMLPVLGIWALVIFPGMLMGKLIDTGWPPSKAFLGAVILSVIISLITYWSQKEVISEVMDNFLESTITLLEDSDTQSSYQAKITEEVSKVFAIFKRLMPSLLALSGVTQLFVGWLILSFLFWICGEFMPSLGNFNFWKMPYYYIYITGLFLCVRLIGGELLQVVADNVLLFIGFFYAVFGFSVFEYYLRKIKLTTFLRVLFYIGFVFLQIPGLILAALVGLFDSYFDFRKVRAKIIG